MKIEKELNQLERHVLRQRFLKHLEEGGKERVENLLVSHIDNVLGKPYCFKVKIFAKDYDKILVYANLPLAGRSYQTLSASVMFIKGSQEFLLTTRNDGLNGNRVKDYLNLISELEGNLPERFTGLGDCLLQDGIDRDGNYHPSRGINVTEGMHKLVAYGLAADMNENHFPISTYFATNQASLPVGMD